MRINDRVLASSAYIFGIPSLYVILTDNRKRPYLGEHASRAFFLWVAFFAVFFGIRLLVPQLEILERIAVMLMGMCALFYGIRAFRAGKIRSRH